MIQGTIHRVGHDLNTDLIHPPKYFSLDRDKVKEGFMKGLDPDFGSRFKPGDLIVGGNNFACGSSRETSIQSMLYNEVGAVVAISFARIFYRNAINNGLPVFDFVNPKDYEAIQDQAAATIDPATATLTVDGKAFQLHGVPAVFKRWLEIEQPGGVTT